MYLIVMFHLYRNMQYYRLIFLFVSIIKLSRCNIYLLPKIVYPRSYNLLVRTTLDENGPNDFTFGGSVIIDVKCLLTSSNLSLHFKYLEINENFKSVCHIRTGRQIQVSGYSYEPEYDFLHIHLATEIEASQMYRIQIKFKGKFTKKLAGYYLSSYNSEDSTKIHWLALTKFEPTYAREAFPCFDEPIYKAKFTIGLLHHKNLTATSNMPKKTQKISRINKNYVLDTFEESVPMSTYLVAYMISDFSYVTSPRELSKTKFRIWARKDAISQVEFAKTHGPRVLTFFENYFDIPYPLPKQDMIAVPDFTSGAMENWGLITFREVFILFDPKEGSKQNKQKSANIICHELAHQWFGNLVTMKWWNDLWLNEGFATYMATVCVHNLYPDWNYYNIHSLKVTRHVFLHDSLAATIPLSKDVDNPNKITELFGGIAYKKGATIIKMMETSLGENVLRQGVIKYLKKHSYKNAAQDDLWEALTYAAHKAAVIPHDWTVKQIMDTWTLQTGYPIVTVTRNYQTGVVTTTQRRYIRSESIETSKHNNPCWWIPLSYTTADAINFNTTIPKLWLTCPHKTEIIHFNKPKEWMIFNIQVSGLYKVNYDETNWKLLIEHLKSKKIEDISDINRDNLIEHIMDFAGLGIVDYDLAFDLLKYLPREKKTNPWQTAFAEFSRIELALSKYKYSVIADYMKQFLEPLYKKYGGRNISSTPNKFIKLAYSKACEYNIQQCKDDVSKIFKSFMENENKKNPIHPDIRGIIYCQALKMGDEKEWNFLWNKYLKSNVVTEKALLLSALGCTSNKKIHEKYVHMILDENSEIRKHDGAKVFVAVANNDVGHEVAKSFLYKNGAAILKLLLPRGNKIAEYFNAVITRIIEDTEFEKFKKFIEKHPQFKEHADLGIHQAIETIKINILWYKKYSESVIKAFKKNT